MKKIALIVVSVIAVLAVLAIGGFYMLFRHGDPLKHAPDEAIVGVNAPNTSIYKLSGEKPLFLNIWATWCPPCVGEMPAIEKMYKKYGDRIHFAAISMDSDPAVVPDFVSDRGFTFPIYTGDVDKLSKDYSIDVIPRSILIGPDGVVIEDHFGAMSEEKMEQFLLKALSPK